MTPSQLESARRLAESGKMRWMPGMRAIEGATYRVVLHGDAYEDVSGTAEWVNVDDGGNYITDLADPATVGCLLAQAREAWGDPSLCACDAGGYDSLFWHVFTNGVTVSQGCMSEGEALVAAILGAP